MKQIYLFFVSTCVSSRENLETWLRENDVPYSFYDFEEEVRSVEQASKQTGLPPQAFVKSLALKTPKEAFVCIIPGNKMLDRGKVAKLLEVGKKKIKILKPEEVKTLIGYPAGGVPPVALNCKVFVDRSVLSMETIVGGGGSIQSLLRIPGDAVLKMEHVEVADLCVDAL